MTSTDHSECVSRDVYDKAVEEIDSLRAAIRHMTLYVGSFAHLANPGADQRQAAERMEQ